MEVSHTFGDSKEKREFNKLVRDKVPSNIEDGGEDVTQAKLSGEFLLRALKEKLIEESFEVLDAVDQDDIVSELADVSEVIDGILSQLGSNKDELMLKQKQKRDKAGGFDDGLVLIGTNNPLLAKIGGEEAVNLFEGSSLDAESISPICDGYKILNRNKEITQWHDRREHKSSNETILNLEIPMTRDSWSAGTREAVIKTDHGSKIQVKISGERIGAKLKIDLSLFVPNEQLELF